MSEPVIAQTSPYVLKAEPGTYFWCACGQSKNQPFCDGSHAGTEFTPVPYKAKAAGVLYFCGCKQSAKQPFCDGTHNGL